MQITRSIREYVEDVIRDKYDKAREEHEAEYRQQQHQFVQEVREKINEFEKELRAFANERGYEFCYKPRVYGPRATGDTPEPAEHFIGLSVDPINYQKEFDIALFNCKLGDAQRAKIRQVLFDLELGKAKKEELVGILDAVKVDVE